MAHPLAFDNSLVLASSSPRRRELLLPFSVRVEVCPPQHVDETPRQNEPPENLVQRLAAAKCQAVMPKYPQRWVLGADTIVFFENEILGKPESMEDARALLRRMSGQTHKVYTGCSIQSAAAPLSDTWCSVSIVTFKELSNEDIDHAMTLTDRLDKAGGYAIQEQEAILVARYTGLRSTIIGLPAAEVVGRWNRLKQGMQHA